MLYQLAGGIMLYSAHESAGDQFLTFEAVKSVFIQPIPQRNGQVQFQIMRADKNPWQPKRIYVPWSAVMMYHEIEDTQLMASIKSELAGLALPPQGLKLVN